jgi:hypothetical protein
MWFGHRLGKTAPDSDAVRLIAETETFLLGDVLEHLQRSGGTIPGWAWLNVFAHGDLRRIRYARHSCSAHEAEILSWQEEVWIVRDPIEDFWREANRALETWWSAERILADEILELVDEDDEALSLVQQRALVPLELRWLNAREDEAPSPYELVQSTRAALRSIMS